MTERCGRLRAMLKLIIIAIVVSLCACNEPAPVAPVNLVCKRIDALKKAGNVDPSTRCEPEQTKAGEHSVHSALVSAQRDGATVLRACALSSQTVTMLCGPALKEVGGEAQSGSAAETTPAK